MTIVPNEAICPALVWDAVHSTTRALPGHDISPGPKACRVAPASGEQIPSTWRLWRQLVTTQAVQAVQTTEAAEAPQIILQKTDAADAGEDLRLLSIKEDGHCFPGKALRSRQCRRGRL